MRVLPGIQHPILDNIQIHNRREEKRAELSHEFQLKLDEYYRVKLKDYYEAKFNLEKYNLAKDIEEINQYMSLKKNLEYYEYRYGIYLGNNLDVFV
jgi:hypothetical protein|tara:strand:- start:223 stop:510 length:288 start_codon:yes stop_codon:yes gene_type:complete